MTRIFAESNEVVTEAVNTNSNTTLSNVGGVYYVGMGVTGTDIPDNTYVSATALGSNQVTISNTATGTTAITATFNKTNYNVPTNPKFRTFGAYSGSERLYTIIYGDATNTSDTISVQGSGSTREYSNLETTEGFRIKNYHPNTFTGINLSTVNLTTHNYFVLIHSDNHLLHHFAKVTKINTDDSLGDSFEFTPSLGTEIEEGTKFMVFKGPSVNSNVFAISAGIKRELQDLLVCARPLFYFFDDELDKEGQLDHNTKYFQRFVGDAAVSGTISPSIHNTFVTASDNGFIIKDYSKYTMNVKMVDNLKDLDYPAYIENFANNPSALPQEYDSPDYTIFTTPNVFTDYNDCFPNARRDGDLDVHPLSDISYTGPIRYVHYDFSPTKANKAYNTFDLVLEESIGKRGSYVEGKAVDNKRILKQKNSVFDKLRVRHRLHREKFNDWFALKATVKQNTTTTNEYTFTTEYDLSELLNEGDEVKIGSHIYIIDTIDSINNSGATGKEQDITLRAERRTETETIFASASYTLAADAIIYRRAWNVNDSTLLTNFDILENRNSNLYVKLISEEFGFLEATVTNSDSNKQLLTLQFDSDTQVNNTNRSISILDYMDGSYYIEVEKFSGVIEKLKSYKDKDTGQSFLDYSGRSDIRKLLGPSINKNTLQSQDIIYSTNSMFNIGTDLSSGAITKCTFDDDEVTFTNTCTGDLRVGDKLFCVYSTHLTVAYIGQVKTIDNGTTVTLEENARAEVKSPAEAVFYTREKHYMFNKALSHNRFMTSCSDLSGASGKGLFFDSGVVINSDGSEGSTLVNTSSVNTSKSIGYHLDNIMKVDAANFESTFVSHESGKNDGFFQARLHDNASSRTYTDTDTINTLLDFNILGVATEEKTSIIEVAPHLPLTLGRVDINYANTLNTIFDSDLLGTTSTATTSKAYVRVSNSDTTALSSTSAERKHYGKPVYAGEDGEEVFIGFFVNAFLGNSSTSGGVTSTNDIVIVLDRKVTIGSSVKVKILVESTNIGTAKTTHELNLLNGGHLHSGKVIALLSPHISSSTVNKTCIFDYPLVSHYSSDSTVNAFTYSEKYGSSYYRIINLEKGNYNKIELPVSGTTVESKNYYADIPSKIKYYASAFKPPPMAPKYSSVYYDIKVRVNKTDTDTEIHPLVESRGFEPVSGSKFWDSTIHKKNGTFESVYLPPTPKTHDAKEFFNIDNSSYAFGGRPWKIKDTLNLIDPKVARMFLFCNSDLLPYSSKRYDSLMYSGQTRDVSNYNLMLLKEPSSDGTFEPKDTINGTTRITQNDSDYLSLNIKAGSKTLSDLKRFSLMCLTEVVYDWSFNQIDPENVISEEKVLPKINLFNNTIVASGINITSISGKVITLDANSSGFIISQQSIIVDSKGRFMGEVNTRTTSSPFTITCFDEVVKTNGDAYYTGQLYYIAQKVTGAVDDFHGRGKEKSFKGNEEIHMLKGVICNGVDGAKFGDSGSDIAGLANADLDDISGSTDSERSDYNIFFPPTFSDQNLVDASSSYGFYNSRIFKLIGDMTQSNSSASIAASDTLYKGMLPIFFKGFSIEEGKASFEDGMVGAYIKSTGLKNGLDDCNGIVASCGTAFNAFENKESSATYSTEDAGGVLMGFKPRLYIDSAEVSDVASNKTVGNRTIYRYNIPIGTGRTVSKVGCSNNGGDVYRTWLTMVDLTGCYLISENSQVQPVSDGGARSAINPAPFIDAQSISGVVPNLIYVLSHEVDTTNTTETHIITVDHSLASGFYRIMQPNHTCFYDYSPKEIILNEVSPKYTKKPFSDEMYSAHSTWAIRDGYTGPRGTRATTGTGEGVLSMYVAIDIDAQSDSSLVVLRDVTKMSSLLDQTSYPMAISDGENTIKSILNYSVDDVNTNLKFSEIKEMLGVVSISEIMALTVDNPDNELSSYKRGLIGSVVNVCDEADTLINNLLEENDIVFDNTENTADSVFLAPNFQETDLMTAINYIAERKDKTFIFEDGIFKIKDKNNADFKTGYFINDVGDIELYGYDKEEDMLNFYNDIVVNGKKHKSRRKDDSSIKAIGRKSLVVYDTKLTTKDEVDQKANSLLALHTSQNTMITIEIGHKNISQLKSGDIVELEIDREDIPRNAYIVLQIKHLLTGNMEVQLGRYSLNIEDRLADLAISIKDINADNSQTEDESTLTHTKIDQVKIKPIRLLIRERKSNGGVVFGFGATLNTNSRPLGFGQSIGVTHTTLLEEEY